MPVEVTKIIKPDPRIQYYDPRQHPIDKEDPNTGSREPALTIEYHDIVDNNLLLKETFTSAGAGALRYSSSKRKRLWTARTESRSSSGLPTSRRVLTSLSIVPRFDLLQFDRVDARQVLMESARFYGMLIFFAASIIYLLTQIRDAARA